MGEYNLRGNQIVADRVTADVVGDVTGDVAYTWANQALYVETAGIATVEDALDALLAAVAADSLFTGV